MGIFTKNARVGIKSTIFVQVKTIHRTYQFELQPTQAQKVLLDKHFGCIRFVFNHFLNERKQQYQENKKSDNYYAQGGNAH